MDAATTELDVEKISTNIASDLIEGMGGDASGLDTLDGAVDTAAAGDDTVAAATDAATDAGKTRGPDGKFAKAPAAAAAPGAPAAAAAPAAATDLPAPKSWSKDMHPIWDKLAKGVPLNADESRKAATYYNEREKQMLDGITGYKTDADFGKTVRGTISKHEPLLRQQGIDPVAAVEHLFNAHHQLSTGTKEQRREYLGKIAKQYGVELTAAPTDPNAPAPSSEFLSLKERQDRLEEALAREETRRSEEGRALIGKQVDEFAADPAHPYFNEVADHIVIILEGMKAQGKFPSIQEAYDTAVRANPVTYEKELARLKQEWENENRKRAAAAVQAARKGTSTNVKGRDTVRAPAGPAATLDKLDDVMRETHEEIRNRAE